MGNGTLLRWVIAVVACILLLSVLGGAVFDQPMGLSYVETESMEPTLDAGDGFVAVPTAVSGDVEEGDVVVFQATNVNNGELTTHRVVGETEQGYITQGDGNTFTDQDAGEPLITDGDIVATALQVGGSVVVIPALGTGVMYMSGVLEELTAIISVTLGIPLPGGAAGLGFILIGAGLVVLVFTLVFERDRLKRVRSWSRSRSGVFSRRWLVIALVVLVALPVAASMIGPSGTHDYGIVSADRETAAAHVIEAGESNTTTHPLDNRGVVPMVAITEPDSEGISVERETTYLEPRSSTEVDVEIDAPEEIGYYNRNLVEYRYPVVLPPSLLVALHNINPLLAGAAVLTTTVSIPVGLFSLVYSSNTYRVRSRSR